MEDFVRTIEYKGMRISSSLSIKSGSDFEFEVETIIFGISDFRYVTKGKLESVGSIQSMIYAASRSEYIARERVDQLLDEKKAASEKHLMHGEATMFETPFEGAKSAPVFFNELIPGKEGLFDTVKEPDGCHLLDAIEKRREEDRSHMSPVQRINALETEVQNLKQRLAKAEKKAGPVKEDRRVDLGNEVKFSDDSFGTNGPAFIGRAFANDGDRCKVLIPEKGYTFKIREDYLNGRPALEIHRE